jgi:enoyl-CoA hydratase
VRAVVLTAEGKGFNAGIDIKEMQSVEGFGHLLGSGAACYAAFEAIYQCPVPTIAAVNDFCMGLGVGLVGSCDLVIAAVNDFCMGLGVGLVGSCDILVASTKARFGLPEVDNGALGCASHLAKLVPPFKLRQMVLTCEPVSAAELAQWGTVYKLCEPDELMDVALATARTIAKKQPRVVKAAKAALNAIDTYDLADNYRLEQGYTYELNLYGDGGEARDAFVHGTRTVTR